MSNATTPRESAVIQDALAKAKPGRKPSAAAAPVDANLDHQALTMASVAADQMAVLQNSYGQERDLVNQLLGQAQMAGAFEEFSRTVRTSKLAYVKEHKLYRSIAGAASPHGAEKLSGTWEEFCRLLGRSVDQVDRDIANVQAFGEQALESMSAMGIGYRELRQYRKLPEDQKQALIEVAKAGDKEGFVELAEEIIAKHAKEKETLAAQVEEAKATLEAKDRVLDDKNKRLNKLEEDASRKFVPPPGSVARTQAELALVKAITQSTSRAYLRMHGVFAAADAALSDVDGGAPEAIQNVARQSIEFLAQQLADMAMEFGIRVNLEERISPDWLDEEALAVLEARNQVSTERTK